MAENVDNSDTYYTIDIVELAFIDVFTYLLFGYSTLGAIILLKAWHHHLKTIYHSTISPDENKDKTVIARFKECPTIFYPVPSFVTMVNSLFFKILN
ncbi:hypothetical protein DFA_08713 [Cavenderia fasciculata]|uniref:Uncharacterized protein n=1 Tax=Cavenderia fasciculata TaxID=261658 RepID=F4Q3W0_CACFS|nr:uncharacterized protein DFA_08713 [Cavenderia fasciculata]EGG17716.1 hypothetical protein DFA_08713 [Cavenderia fasciculata]|eukprot:XP_004356200.1 hypothetical protein DFA_08713 [Cavenderia fasciculata]